jgi:ribosomal protein S6--L-glutamate ligase
MGLEVCGVDLLGSNHGPVVMEVNSSPGLEGIESASGKDVADIIYQYLEKRVAEVSLRGSRSRTRGKG